MKLKDQIIHESLKLFSLKGFLSTSIHDILLAANTSKGGFYNHFKSKEDLFYQVLTEARRIWRERNFFGLNEIESPFEKIRTLLENYKNRYLKDAENFPGGCVFITFSIELGDQRPLLAKEVNKGFDGVKNLIKRLLEEGKSEGELSAAMDTDVIAEVLFAGMLGASVSYITYRSAEKLDKSIAALIDYLEQLKA